MRATTCGRSSSCHSVRAPALRGSMVIRTPPEAGTRTAATSPLLEACGVKCTGFQMRRDPAGIAATDFKGSAEPRENGRTESWNVPRVALPAQPGGAAATNVSTPYPVGFAELAFTGTMPVIATQEAGYITKPAGYTYESHGSWSAVHNVAHTWTGGARVGLAETRSGLRLIDSVDNASYQPVVAAWTGAGISKPTQTGDHNP